MLGPRNFMFYPNIFDNYHLFFSEMHTTAASIPITAAEGANSRARLWILVKS